MAYEFASASSQYLRTSSSPVSGVPLTLACWFRGNGTPATGVFWPIIVLNDTGSNDRVNIAVTGSNVTCAFVDDGVDAATATATGEYTSGSWIHGCAIHASSSSREIYVNGVSKGTNTSALNSLSSFNRMTIGSNHIASAFFNGSIAEVGVWNVALTASEIASLAKGVTCDQVRPQSLVFYAPLIRDLVDLRGGLTITNNNTATVSAHPRVYA